MTTAREGGGGQPPAEDWDDPDEHTVVWTPPEWVEEEAASSSPAHAVPSPVRESIEVDVRTIPSETALAQQRKRVYEVWTRNRVYGVDAQMTCVEVTDLTTGRAEEQHPFLGARLVGGQSRDDDSDVNVLTFPLPMPGHEAVFQRTDERHRIQLQVTSRVTRVVLHVQRVKVEASRRDHHWGRITRR